MTAVVAVFSYNRPKHLTRVLDALRRNRVSDLVIFQDGLRAGHDPIPFQEVANILKHVEFGHARIVTRDTNLGLAGSIIRGVDEVLADHDRVIVLEDDCVPSPKFVDWSEWALEKFADVPRVFSVSGYALPKFPVDYQFDMCFSPLPSSWGWSTWRNRWCSFDPHAAGWRNVLEDAALHRRFAAVGDLFPMMLRHQIKGEIDSWAIRWYLSVFLEDGVCVYPIRSMIRNIGMDGSGVHGVHTTAFDVAIEERFDPSTVRVPQGVEIDKAILRVFSRQFARMSPSVVWRVLRHPRSWPRVIRQVGAHLLSRYAH